MWGVHIGLGFATRVTYGGFWILVTVAVAAGNPRYGALLMLFYWLGRSLPLWVAPLLIKSDSDGNNIPERIWEQPRLYHRIAGIGLVWSAVVTAFLAAPHRYSIFNFYDWLSL